MTSASNNPEGGETFHGNTNRYWFVWLALLAMTALTYFTAKQHWPTVALPLALFIAGVKAGLVVTIFMHLKDVKGPPLISFSVSVFLVLALILGVLGDLAFRNPMSRPDKVPTIQLPPVGYNYPAETPVAPIGNPRGVPAAAPAHGGTR